MDSNAHEETASSWGIIGVDLDDIEAPENIPNDTALRMDRDPLEFAMPPDDDDEEGVANSSFYWPSIEPVSLFDRFPEAFVEDDKLPYSAMVRIPGSVPECLENNSPRPDQLAARAANMSAANVQGEMGVEQHFKQKSSDPYGYFFRIAAFCCIMDLVSEGFIQPSVHAIFIGRLFDGDLGLMDVYNRYFMPPGFRIEYTTSRAVIHNVLFHVRCKIAASRPRPYHPRFLTMIKVLLYMEQERMSNGVHQDEIVGKLVSVPSGREFLPHPGAHTILHGSQLSGRFMKRSGPWWPHKEVSWQEADLMGLYSPTEAKKEDTVASVNPRRLTVRRKGRNGT